MASSLSRMPLLLSLLLLRHVSALTTPSAPIIISGCGPAALVFAHRFLSLTKNDTSSSVVNYEKRGKPLRYIDTFSDSCVAGDNAFGFGVSQKSQAVLRKTPGLLEAVQAISQPAAFAPGIELRIVNRRELCAEMIHALENEFGSSGRLQLNFGQAVVDLDLETQQVEVMDVDTNTTKRHEYSLLIAADGTNSIVRSKLIEEGQVKCERYYTDYTWKALQLPEQPQLDASTFVRYPKPFSKPHKFLQKDNGAIIPRFQDCFVLLNFHTAPPDGEYESPYKNNPFGATTPAELKASIAQVVLPNVTYFPSDDVLQDFLNKKIMDEVGSSLCASWQCRFGG